MTASNPRAEVTVYSPLFSPFRQQLQGPTVTIGRASDCSIPIKDRYLSRRHAEIVAGDGHWVLKDLGSANGTYLNGSRVERELRLHAGDRIRLDLRPGHRAVGRGGVDVLEVRGGRADHDNLALEDVGREGRALGRAAGRAVVGLREPDRWEGAARAGEINPGAVAAHLRAGELLVCGHLRGDDRQRVELAD